MDVSIRTFPALRLIKVHKLGPYELSAPAAWQELMTWAEPRGLVGPETVRIGIGNGDPEVMAPGDLTYDACITVERSVEVQPPVMAEVFPAGEYAVVVHKGAFRRLVEAYHALMLDWLPQSGRERAGRPFEVYVCNPQTTPASELRTEVRLALKPK
jgi:AraC family transcriptional regulator